MKQRLSKYFLFFSVLVLQSVSHAQSPAIVDNGVVVKIKRQKKIRGSLLISHGLEKQIKTLKGDTVTFNMKSVKKMYFPDQITLFSNKRFHYKNGFLWNYSMGFAGDHFNMDLSVNKRINHKLELGFGTGVHSNFFSFFTPSDFVGINVTSFPYFGQVKYALNNHRKRLYVRGRLGYVNNINSWNVTDVKDGVMFESALGLTFAGKRKTRFYVELSQYSSYASGKSTRTEMNGMPMDIDFNIWFNNVVFTLGFEFGGKMTRMNKLELP